MLAPHNPAGYRYRLILLGFIYFFGKALPRNLSRGSASSANLRGEGAPAPRTHNQRPEYLVFAIFIRSIPFAGQITGNWQKQAAGYW